MDFMAYFITLALEGNSVKVDRRELECSVRNIWHESRGEDPGGWARVSETVRERVIDPMYPNTYCGVIYSGAFDWTKDSISDDVKPKDFDEVQKLEEIVQVAWIGITNGYHGIVNRSTHYYNPKKVGEPCWASAFDSYVDYGDHRWMYDYNGTTPCYDQKMLAQK